MQQESRNPVVRIVIGVILAALWLPFSLAISAASAALSFLRRSGNPSGERARAERSKVDTSKWTLELLRRLEWRRFEDLCAAFSETQGYKAQVDIVVQCRAWSASIGIQPVRELRGAMGSAKIGRGVFFAAGKFTREARDFAAKEGIQLVDGTELLGKIAGLPPETAAGLLKLATQGEFLTPTCPSCGIKMTSSQSTRDGRKYWACCNYPRCKQTFFNTANAPG